MANPIQLYDSRAKSPPSQSVKPNPLPQILQLPSGLALLELQGTINLPDRMSEYDDDEPSTEEVSVGRLVFPDYDAQDTTNTTWMKRVYMYVGKHQRLTGEVKKLPKAIAIIRKQKGEATDQLMAGTDDEVNEQPIEDLEIVEIVKYKLIFSSRPEPVGVYEAGE